jgi:hypothetical protein
MNTHSKSTRFTRIVEPLQEPIPYHLEPIKTLDIFSGRSILPPIPAQFSHPVNFQHNPSLSGMAMKMGLPKVLKVKPPRNFGSFQEAFSFGR